MPITVQDVDEFIRIVEANPELKRALQERLVDAEAIQRALRDPEKRDEIRRIVLGDEWEDIPTILRQLAEGQQRHEAILQEHTQILQEHTQQLAMLIETQQRHEAILQEHTQQLAMLIETQQRHEAILQEHTQILQEHTQQLAMLIETQQRHEAILQEHTRILQEHTQQLAMLVETVQRHEAILQQHTEMLMRQEMNIQALREEFQGLAGRFEGEVYERRTVRRAPSIFNGGGGGAIDNPAVRRRLRQWFRAAYGEIPVKDEVEDVYSADLIWWKNGNVILGEISIKVDRWDVVRAKRRAQLLRQVGVNAMPVVIGTEWAMHETLELARSEGVEWVVGGQYSDGAMAFRKLPETEGDDVD
jgi:hypothetical protein